MSLRSITAVAFRSANLCKPAVYAALAVIGATFFAPVVSAQLPQRIYEQTPFDKLTVIEGAGTQDLNVRPLPLPNRRVPANPKPSDKLKIRLLEDDREFEVLWSHIKAIVLFEQMIVAEAARLTQQGKLDEAYDHFAFLYQTYPDAEGIAEAHAAYLYQSAGAAFKQQKYDEALAVLEELFVLDRTYRASESSPTLMQVLSGIADKLIGGYVAKQDYRSARALLRRLSDQYKAAAEPFAMKWQAALVELAATKRDEAREHLAASRFVEAYDAARGMQDVWPDVEGGAELSAEIARRYPLVTVGVWQQALEFDSHSLFNPAARRAGRLVERRLMEFTGMGSEGGKYVCPLGTFKRSDDGLQLLFELGGGAGNGYQVSRHLLEMSDPASFSYSAAWARLMAAVRVQQVQQVEVDLRFPHVLPEALLRTTYQSVEQGGANAGNGPYVIFQKTAGAIRYTANTSYAIAAPTRPAEVVERYFDDPQRALLALRRGEVDCLDNVFPGDIVALKKSADLAVLPYSAPTTHVLVPGRENPFVENRTFRRALLYGSNREAIVQQGLLRGTPLAGYRVVSAPFPAPASVADPVAYGYDERIAPRPHDAALALTLRVLAERELKADYERREEEPPKLAPLVLGHPADEVSRIACRALVKHWDPIGIPCKLLEFPPGQFTDTGGKCDLVYLQLAAWEPVVDAGRLFGDDGIVPIATPFFRLTLRKIETARNWQEARARLQELHRLVHEEVTLIPLWQTVDHYAYRRTLQGLDRPRAALYMDVEQWHTSPRLAGN